MKKVSISNLGLIVTNKCNLDCDHCLRGCKDSKDMSKIVIENTLKQFALIGNLCLCGGEVTYSLDTLNYIFDYIIRHEIIVQEVTTTINGTNYSEEFLNLLKKIDEYISRYKDSKVSFTISYDEYHLKNIKKYGLLEKYLENLKKYSKTEYFLGLQKISNKTKLYREGNAIFLDKKLTVDLKPIDLYVTYAGKNYVYDEENGLCNIGPIMSVNPDGIITDCDASIDSQKDKFYFGNVFENTFEEIALKRGKVVKPKHFCKKMKKSIKYHLSYNR